MEELEISLVGMMSVLKKRWVVIVFPALIAGLIAHFVAPYMQKPEYESKAVIRVGFSRGTPLESAATLKGIMTTLSVLNLIAENIDTKGDPNMTTVLENMITYTVTDQLITVSMVSEDKNVAYQVVTKATEIIIERHNQLYRNSVVELNKAINFVRDVVKPVPLSAGLSEFITRPSEMVEKANLPEKPIDVPAIPYFTTFFLTTMLVMIMVMLYIDRKAIITVKG